MGGLCDSNLRREVAVEFRPLVLVQMVVEGNVIKGQSWMGDASKPFAKQSGPARTMDVVVFERIEDCIIGPGLLEDELVLFQNRALVVATADFNHPHRIRPKPVIGS
jgi:hypothetical protein